MMFVLGFCYLTTGFYDRLQTTKDFFSETGYRK